MADQAQVNPLLDPDRFAAFEQALQGSQDKLRTAVMDTLIVLWRMDPQGIVTLSEGNGLARIGLTPGEVVGKSIFDLNAGRSDIQAAMLRVLAGEELVTELESAGEIFLTHYSPQYDDLGLVSSIIAVTQIVTENRQIESALYRKVEEALRAGEMLLLEQRVAERTREISALLEVSRNVVSTLEITPLLSLILSQLKTVVEYTGAAIAVFEGDDLVILDYQGLSSREQMLSHRLPFRLLLGYHERLMNGLPVIVGDVSEISDQFAAKTPEGERLRRLFGYTRSWMAVPLMVKEHPIGVLWIEHQEENFFNEEQARLALAFANQAAVALENARLYEQARSLAALQERQKLARDLHDSVSQALYGIVLGVKTARRLLESDPERAIQPLDYTLSLAQAGLEDMRALIFELRPDSLEKEGLVVALSRHIDLLRSRHSLQIVTDFCTEPSITLNVKEALFRIAQEAINNAIHHAFACRVRVCLDQVGGKLRLIIADNGAGFNPAADFPGHFGLSSMAERAAQIGAAFEIQSSPKTGTIVLAEVGERQKPAIL